MPITKETLTTRPDGTQIHRVVTSEKNASVEMAEAPGVAQPLPTLATIGILGAVTAVVVWGVVEIIKSFFKGWSKANPDAKRPWYWAGSLRLLSLVLGAGVGTALYSSLGGVGSGWPWGTAIGGGAGCLATLIVWAVKSRIKKAA